MDNKKDTLLSEANSAARATVDIAQRLANDFEQLLDEEHALLGSASTQNLQKLADKKKSLVDSLTTIEPQLIKLLKDYPEQPEIASIRKILGKCQTRNRDNQVLTQLVLKHTNSSLELLRTLQQMDDLSLYAASGELDVKREQRDLGSA
jgi:flagellar biosynthesis/type III secretory pathway chaperone